MSLKDKLDEALSEEEIEIDFSGAVSFEPLEPGEYSAVVEKCEASVSKAGNPMVVFTFKITDGEFKSRQFKKWAPTRGAGAGIFRDILAALGGYSVDTIKKFKCSSALGKSAIITVDFQDGSDTNQEIKSVKPHTFGSKGKLS